MPRGKVLQWFMGPETLVADGATENSPVVLARMPDGTLVPCHAPYQRQFRFTISGKLYEHTKEALDGTWIYEGRIY